MGEIKSTLDIIMEKTKGLTMTEEEKRKFKRKELEGKVSGVLQKLIDGLLDWDQLDIQLMQLKETQSREIVNNVLLESVSSRIEPGGEDNEPLLQLLSRNLGLNIEPLQNILTLFEEDVAENSVVRQRLLKENLRSAGISGTAVIPNIKADPEWKHYIDQKKLAAKKDISAVSQQQT